MEKLKEKLGYIVQLTVAVGLVIFILLHIDLEKFIIYFTELEIKRFLLILPFSLAGLYIQFLRWKYLVSAYSAHFELRDLVPSFFAGFALRLLVPGGHAEISKIFLLPGKKKGKALAFGMERFFQTFIKVLLITLVVPLHFEEYTLPAILTLALLILLYIGIPHIKFLHNLLEKEVFHYRLFFINLGYALLLYGIMTIQYTILLNGVYPIGIMETAQTVVFLWSAGIIPISISGLGIREGLAAFFLAQYGIAPAYAVATSLFLFTLNNFFPALIGGYYLYKKRSHLNEIRDSWQHIRRLWNSLKSNHEEK